MGGDLPWQRQRYGCCGAGALDKNLAQKSDQQTVWHNHPCDFCCCFLSLLMCEFEKMPSSQLEL